jgi:hypothetical protein
MMRSLQNVVPSHLADRKLFDFAGLQVEADCAPSAERAAAGTEAIALPLRYVAGGSSS